MANHNSARAFILSQAEARKRKADRAGWSLIAACVLGFAGIFGAAYQHDSSVRAAKASAAPSWRLEADNGRDSYVLDHGLTLDDCAGFARSAAKKWQHVYCVPGKADSNRVTAEEAKASGASAIMGAIAGELRKSGCTVKIDSPATYTVERC